MFGLGVLKGLGITLRHFVNTFADDLKYMTTGGSTTNEEAFARRQGPTPAGLFTVEYPEMKLKTPENFRFIPFLVTDYDVPPVAPEYDRAKALEMNRCTSCGICAKVCPPQCIWIVRTNDPKTGKPIPQPAEFYIDTDICMNCGYCAEFCPFDAIKMDHDFELADYERTEAHIHDIYRLTKPVSYYASIRPTWNAREEATRQAAEEEKRRKDEEKQRQAAERAAAAKAEAEAKEAEAPVAATNGDGIGGGGAQPQLAKKTPEEIKAQREAMLAKKQQRAMGQAAPAAETPPEAAPVSPPSPTEAPVADDLTRIEGIGPQIAKLLQESGITTFAQLAGMDTGQLEQILDKGGSRFRVADPASWTEQARLAAEGKWAEFETLQSQLKGGRRREE